MSIGYGIIKVFQEKHNVLVYGECTSHMAEIEEEFNLSVPELEGYLVTNHSFSQFTDEHILVSADYSLFHEGIGRSVFTVFSLKDVLDSKIITTKNILANDCDICGSSTSRKMKHVYSINKPDIKQSIQTGTFSNVHHSPVVICDECHTAIRNDLFVELSNGVKLTYTI